jgi:mono/diheme cytochrome c family protein
MRLLVALVALTAAAWAADTGAAAGPVTFNKDILPILQKNCQNCHRPGNVAPMSLLTYESARPWAKAMKTAVATRKMPPWFADPQYGHFSNDRSLAKNEIDLIAKWADSGAPQGDAKEAPPPLEWAANGWATPPDVILKGVPYVVPATPPKNVIEWADVYTPGNFTKDTWVTSIEIKPSELGVTHHICTSFIPHRDGVVYNTPLWVDKQRDDQGVEVPPSERKLVLPTADGKGRVVDISSASPSDRALARGNVGIGFVCYVPGRSLHDFRPHNAALLVPAGYDVAWQIHYTPNGKEVTDLPEVGLTIAKQAPERIMIESFGGGADPKTFAIPPNDPNWETKPSVINFNEDAELVWMAPHMHLRGKDMTYRLQYPDGKTEVVLSVPHYDFNWQLGYEVAEPIKIPKGSKLLIVAHYDNSPNNRFNPDPSRTVYQGNMTWEEMFAPFFAITVDKKVNPAKAFTIPFAGANRGGA